MARNSEDGGWVRADGRPLSDFDVWVYRQAGLEPAEALQWADAGFEPYAAAMMRDAGADLDTAVHLRDLGLSHYSLGIAAELGITIDELAARPRVWLDADQVRRIREAGVDPAIWEQLSSADRSMAFLRELSALGISNEQALAWDREGLPLHHCVTALATVPANEVPGEVPWVAAFPRPEDRICWKMAGLCASDATMASSRGFRPIDVLDGLDHPPTRRPLVIINEEHVARRLDGTAIPNEVLDIATEGGMTRWLQRFGFVVRRTDPARRFVAASTGGAAFTLRSLGRPRHLLRIRLDGDQWSVERLASDDTTIGVGRTSTLMEAVGAVGQYARRLDATLRRLDGPGLDVLQWLQLLEPWAAEADAAPSIWLGRLKAVRERDVTGRWLYVPDDPKRWPLYRKLHDAPVEVVGSIVFRQTGFDGVELFGSFQDVDEGVAAAIAASPLIEVRRTRLSGEQTLARLDQTTAGRLAPEQVLDAISRTPSLGRISGEAVTEIIVAPHAGCPVDDVATRLHIEAGDINLDSEVEWPDALADLDINSGTSPSEQIGNLPIFINDERWLLCKPQGRRTIVFLRADDDWLDSGTLIPSISQLWGSFAFCETASRTSGVNEWWLGVATDDVLVDVTKRDEQSPEVTLRATKPTRRLAEIVDWLAGLSAELSLDLAMLAAEVISGHVDEGETPGSLFDDDATDTLDCNLHLTVESKEEAAFHRLLSQTPAGRRAVEAIRQPASEAARRRAQRREQLESSEP